MSFTRPNRNFVGENSNKRNVKLESFRKHDRTVLISDIAFNATEAEVIDFLEANCQEKPYFRLIRDTNTGVSKGIGYAEFETIEGFSTALKLMGKVFKGQKIRVHASQAERNRSAKILKHQRTRLVACRARTLLVSGFEDNFRYLDEEDVQFLFEGFGNINNITIPIEKHTGKNFGELQIEFADIQDAYDTYLTINKLNYKSFTLSATFLQHDTLKKSTIYPASNSRALNTKDFFTLRKNYDLDAGIHKMADTVHLILDLTIENNLLLLLEFASRYGVVLAHTGYRQSYFIQFETQHQGYLFYKDFMKILNDSQSDNTFGFVTKLHLCDLDNLTAAKLRKANDDCASYSCNQE